MDQRRGIVSVSDWSSDLTVTPPLGSGGVGLGTSPGDTLLSNISGYCDFLDANGQWLAGGTDPPADAAFVRRWSVVPLVLPPETLSLQVMVLSLRSASGPAIVPAAQGASGAWLAGIRTRRDR